jgi:hypothetical protein
MLAEIKHRNSQDFYGKVFLTGTWCQLLSFKAQ